MLELLLYLLRRRLNVWTELLQFSRLHERSKQLHVLHWWNLSVVKSKLLDWFLQITRVRLTG